MPSNQAQLAEAIGTLLHQLHTHPQQIPEAITALTGLNKYLTTETHHE